MMGTSSQRLSRFVAPFYAYFRKCSIVVGRDRADWCSLRKATLPNKPNLQPPNSQDKHNWQENPPKTDSPGSSRATRAATGETHHLTRAVKTFGTISLAWRSRRSRRIARLGRVPWVWGRRAALRDSRPKRRMIGMIGDWGVHSVGGGVDLRWDRALIWSVTMAVCISQFMIIYCQVLYGVVMDVRVVMFQVMGSKEANGVTWCIECFDKKVVKMQSICIVKTSL